MKNVHNLLISFFRKNLEGKFYAFTCHRDFVQIVLYLNFKKRLNMNVGDNGVMNPFVDWGFNYLLDELYL